MASYLTLEKGSPVVDRFGTTVGPVENVLLHGDGSFDGVVVATPLGTRFVDAPEVRRIFQGCVVLGITHDQVLDPGATRRYGHRLARPGRDTITEADRDAVIECLKRAFVRDEIEVEELAELVAVAHSADNLEDLDAALGRIEVLP
jgi:hypothetical protein